jgi:hypothetical protein
MRRNIEVVPQALKVLIEVQDGDARILGRRGDRQIRETEAMGAVGTPAANSRIVARTARCTLRSTGTSRRLSSVRSTAAIPSGPRASTISS